MSKCLNCNTSFEITDSYCANCGQKVKISQLNVWTIIRDFLQNLFNIDSKIWNTFKAIWVPAKLTNAFVEGQRKSYYNPLRIFLVSLFAFFTLFLLKTKDGLKEIDDFTESQHQYIWEDNLISKYDSLNAFNESNQIDSFKIQLFDLYVKQEIDSSKITEEMRQRIKLRRDSIDNAKGSTIQEFAKGFQEGMNGDSENKRDSIKDSQSNHSESFSKGLADAKEGWNSYGPKDKKQEEKKSTQDKEKDEDGFEFYYTTDGELHTSINGSNKEDEEDEDEGKSNFENPDSLPTHFILRPRRNNMRLTEDIKGEDFFRLSPEEIREKHGKGKWYREIFFVQLQKMLENLSSSITFFISNGTWAILVTILLMALLFKFLYVRHNIYYVEHFIFHLYGHTRLLLIAIMAMIVDSILGLGWWIMLAGFFAGLYYLFAGMLRYYKQSKGKTFLKYLVVLNTYVIILSICCLLILAVSFVVF